MEELNEYIQRFKESDVAPPTAAAMALAPHKIPFWTFNSVVANTDAKAWIKLAETPEGKKKIIQAQKKLEDYMESTEEIPANEMNELLFLNSMGDPSMKALLMVQIISKPFANELSKVSASFDGLTKTMASKVEQMGAYAENRQRVVHEYARYILFLLFLYFLSTRLYPIISETLNKKTKNLKQRTRSRKSKAKRRTTLRARKKIRV